MDTATSAIHNQMLEWGRYVIEADKALSKMKDIAEWSSKASGAIGSSSSSDSIADYSAEMYKTFKAAGGVFTDSYLELEEARNKKGTKAEDLSNSELRELFSAATIDLAGKFFTKALYD